MKDRKKTKTSVKARLSITGSKISMKIKVIDTYRFELILIMFAIILVSSGLTGLLYNVLINDTPLITALTSSGVISWVQLLSCVVISTALSVLLSGIFIKPIKEITRATDEVTRGNYSVSVPETHKEKSEIGQLQRSFNHMTRELGSIEMFKDDFIDNFSHEFKTPIVSIRGFANQLRVGDLTEEERKEYIDIIASESERLIKMSTNILLLSSLENRQIVNDKTEFYLDEQIRHAILLLEKKWSIKNIELNIDLEEAKYYFNEEMLMQVWINLLNNAIKYTPEGGEIGCELKRTEDGGIKVTVWDTGIGMNEETRNRMFDKFYQGDRSHNGDGNGIGLSIVKRIITLCEGDIKVYSAPNEGTRIEVTL